MRHMVATEVHGNSKRNRFDRIPGPEPIVHFAKMYVTPNPTIQLYRAKCAPQNSEFNL